MLQVDKPEHLKDGSVPGVKNAAVRKLDHELGIAAEDVPVDSFKFLTRLHYYAADAVTHGPNAPWGEHEIDYILFIQVRPLARSMASTEGLGDDLRRRGRQAVQVVDTFHGRAVLAPRVLSCWALTCLHRCCAPTRLLR